MKADHATQRPFPMSKEERGDADSKNTYPISPYQHKTLFSTDKITNFFAFEFFLKFYVI